MFLVNDQRDSHGDGLVTTSPGIAPAVSRWTRSPLSGPSLEGKGVPGW